MKKRVVIIALGGLLAVLFIMARLTHGLDYLRIPTSSNEPTFHPGSILFASRFKKPGRNTFVCFKKKNDKYLYVYRCIAKGGDILEIKNAVVYLNNRKLDEPYTWNEYHISSKELSTIQGYVDKFKYPLQSLSDSTYSITLSSADLRNYHLNLKPVILEKGVADSELFIDFRKYSPDNFGPVKVPENSYFLMGDNRHDAFDSRYIGFIKADAIVSTVIR